MHGEKEWYFFTPRDRKYRNGYRPNRAAGDGYWKATGADKTIKFNDSVVGFRKVLVYYAGKPPKGDKTSWIMHEFRVSNPSQTQRTINDMRLDDWVLCRIYKKEKKSNGANHRHQNDGIGTQQVRIDHEIQNQQCDTILAPDQEISSTPLIGSAPIIAMNNDYYSNGVNGSEDQSLAFLMAPHEESSMPLINDDSVPPIDELSIDYYYINGGNGSDQSLAFLLAPEESSMPTDQMINSDYYNGSESMTFFNSYDNYTTSLHDLQNEFAQGGPHQSFGQLPSYSYHHHHHQAAMSTHNYPSHDANYMIQPLGQLPNHLMERSSNMRPHEEFNQNPWGGGHKEQPLGAPKQCDLSFQSDFNYDQFLVNTESIKPADDSMEQSQHPPDADTDTD